MQLDFNFGPLILFLVLVGALLMFGINEAYDRLTGQDGTIRVEQPIEPSIELIIRDNQVDTVYVYAKP